ncbi:hypothetical protein EVAR_39135_1 [Eumeta japonica]|uniref:Uncharacterized protein n=1 Tax=Eumeta variegata TaxID=151549 RepID=A0A4C1X5L0_EUMVA|nr:hypothetical protein EVAR_39135_1 [Eumeta japonica]
MRPGLASERACTYSNHLRKVFQLLPGNNQHPDYKIDKYHNCPTRMCLPYKYVTPHELSPSPLLEMDPDTTPDFDPNHTIDPDPNPSFHFNPGPVFMFSSGPILVFILVSLSTFFLRRRLHV